MRRKGYAPHYVPANLAKFQPEMHEPTLELVNVRHLLAFLFPPSYEYVALGRHERQDSYRMPQGVP